MDTITITAPIPAGQDAPAPAGAGIDAPDTATRLEATREAHTVAVENHTAARQRATAAATAHSQAIGAREALLARASAGEPVMPEDLTHAGTTVAQAKDAADLASSIANGAGTRAERAHINVLEAEADHIRAAYHQALRRQVAAAEAVDLAFAGLQKAIKEHDDVAYDTGVTAGAVHMHNRNVEAVATSNRVLASLEPSAVPAIRDLSTNVAIPAVKAAYVTDRWGEPAIDPIDSVAGRLRSAFGIRVAGSGT